MTAAAGGGGDRRKEFILSTVHNYFGLPAAERRSDCPELERFLDDGNEFVLSARRAGGLVLLTNKVEASDTKEKVLVFFKIRPEVITEENLHKNVLVSSMLDSPINTLYQAVRQIFAPLLLKDEKWNKEFDPKLQTLLSDLEAGLGSVLRRTAASRGSSKSGGEEGEDDLQGILTPSDEFQFWTEIAESWSNSGVRERAAHFLRLFQAIEKYYRNLDALPLAEVLELVETTRETVDDVWRQTEHDPYPEPRMKQLLEIIGNALGRCVQKNLSDINLWTDPFPVVKENLRAGIAVCEQWTAACEHMTGQLWRRYTPHMWKNEKYIPESLQKLGRRLEEVFTIRMMHEKLMYFLPPGEDHVQRSKKLFEPFAGLNPVHYNPYTEPSWRAAVSQYERIIEPAEEKISSKLKSYFSDIHNSPQQLLQAFQRHKDLVKRPSIRKRLILERETLLARLVDYIKDIRSDFEARCHGSPGDSSGPLTGKNLPEVVNNIVWVRQLQLKIW